MAKRGAEALACRVPPWENLLSHTPPKRSRGDPELDEPRHAPLWRGSGSKKRKRGAEEEEEEEAAALNGRRAEGKRGVGSAAVAQAGTPPPPPPRVGTVEATLSEGEGFVAEQRHRSPKTPDGDKSEDVWRYNSFQYWRLPLPTVNLADILDLGKEDMVEARDSSKASFSEMEP